MSPKAPLYILFGIVALGVGYSEEISPNDAIPPFPFQINPAFASCQDESDGYDDCWDITTGNFTHQTTGTAYIYGATISDSYCPPAPHISDTVSACASDYYKPAPVILVEGYDPDNEDTGPKIYEIVDVSGLASTLRAAGYDIIILDFGDSTKHVQSNSGVLRELLLSVNSKYEEEAIVIGVSLGGIVARHALASMEGENGDEDNHGVKLFISFDAPHKGANIPLGIQYWIKFFSTDQAVKEQLDQLHAPVAVQMLLYHAAAKSNETGQTLYLDSPQPHPLHDELFGSLGYPNQLRKVAIANGNGFGMGQNGFLQGDRMIEWEFGSYLSGNVWGISADDDAQIFGGRIGLGAGAHILHVHVKNAIPYDNSPGGYLDASSEIAATDIAYGDIKNKIDFESFIPTISALDIQASDPFVDISGIDDIYDHTPFDQIYYPGILDSDNPTANQKHAALTAENIQWVLCEILYDNGHAYVSHGCNDTGIGEQGRPAHRAESAMAEDVRIGVISPVTGGAAGYGQDIFAASRLAIDDFNAYLADANQDWRLVPIYKDSKTDPNMLIPALEYLDSMDVKAVAGPSIDIINTKVTEFAGEHGMLLLSCCSVTLDHATADDNLYRLTPNQTNHGYVVGNLMYDQGKTGMVVVGRDSGWITDLLYAAVDAFAERGGTSFGTILYSTYEEFGSLGLEQADRAVEEALSAHDVDEVAVLYVGFEETYALLEDAAAYGNLARVQWFGADANTILHDYTLDTAAGLGFTSVQPVVRGSQDIVSVADRLHDMLGRFPSVYAYQQYDGVWLLGRAILETGEAQAESLKSFLDGADHLGMGGLITFDGNGDRDHMEYGVWEVVDGRWVVTDITGGSESVCLDIIHGRPYLTIQYLQHVARQMPQATLADNCTMIPGQ